MQETFVTQVKAAREIYYWQICDLAAAVDARLRRGEHLRTRSGAVIAKFDQWLLAAERGEWP